MLDCELELCSSVEIAKDKLLVPHEGVIVMGSSLRLLPLGLCVLGLFQG